MSRIRDKNTRPEMFVRSFLHKRGYRLKIHDKALPCRPDIVLRKHKTAILINGCFWHQHPNCKIPKTRLGFWRKKLKNNITRQKQDIVNSRENGFKVIVAWECKIYKNTLRIASSIAKNLEE